MTQALAESIPFTTEVLAEQLAGLTEVEIAGALGITERTVRRDWNKARTLLLEALR